MRLVSKANGTGTPNVETTPSRLREPHRWALAQHRRGGNGKPRGFHWDGPAGHSTEQEGVSQMSSHKFNILVEVDDMALARFNERENEARHPQPIPWEVSEWDAIDLWRAVDHAGAAATIIDYAAVES
jgi:hypothetical protein